MGSLNQVQYYKEMKLVSVVLLAAAATAQVDPRIVYEGGEGIAAGKRVVFVSGDEEYRSEQSLPLLARILSKHGAHCTVLFAIDPKTGEIDPGVRTNIPGLEALATADLMVLFTRFRDLPDEQMRHVVDYVQAVRPIVALRTATHAFAFEQHETHARWSWNSKEWDGGFGRQVLGETWIAHHGAHGTESARGIVAPGREEHAILRGIDSGDVWDPADVYRVRLPLREGCEALLLGQVLDGMTFDSPPAKHGNEPMMPVAWTTQHHAADGRSARVFTTTMGAAEAFVAEGTRRLLVNACLWALGLEAKITPDLDVAIVGDYAPRPFGFGGHERGVRPRDLIEGATKPSSAGRRKEDR
jgi:hypothetical protein